MKFEPIRLADGERISVDTPDGASVAIFGRGSGRQHFSTEITIPAAAGGVLVTRDEGLVTVVPDRVTSSIHFQEVKVPGGIKSLMVTLTKPRGKANNSPSVDN